MSKSALSIGMSLKGALPSVKNQMRDIMMMVAQEAVHEWHKIARQALHGTAHAYTSSIGEPVYDGKQVTITLRADTPEGRMANMIEQGCPPFDMKPGLLAGRKARYSEKSGAYTTVPLRLKAYGSHGDSPPVMPSTIYRSARQLEIGQSMTLPRKYEGYGMRTRLSSDIKRWGHYTWQTSPFQGITKVARWPNLIPLSLPRETAGMYMVFRRVSKKSSANSWIHPGFRQHNFLEKTVSYIDEIFPRILNNVMGAR